MKGLTRFIIHQPEVDPLQHPIDLDILSLFFPGERELSTETVTECACSHENADTISNHVVARQGKTNKATHKLRKMKRHRKVHDDIFFRDIKKRNCVDVSTMNWGWMQWNGLGVV